MPVDDHDTAPGPTRKAPAMQTLWTVLGAGWVLTALWAAAVVCGLW
jgi:hypothetical protein